MSDSAEVEIRMYVFLEEDYKQAISLAPFKHNNCSIWWKKGLSYKSHLLLLIALIKQFHILDNFIDTV